MDFNNQAFFDSLEPEKASLIENKQAFNEILWGFIEGKMPNLDNITLEQIEAFEKDYMKLHFVRNADKRATLSGESCLLKEMLQSYLFIQSLEKVEIVEDDEDEQFI